MKTFFDVGCRECPYRVYKSNCLNYLTKEPCKFVKALERASKVSTLEPPPVGFLNLGLERFYGI